jgi:hypothetical protein
MTPRFEGMGPIPKVTVRVSGFGAKSTHGTPQAMLTATGVSFGGRGGYVAISDTPPYPLVS